MTGRTGIRTTAHLILGFGFLGWSSFCALAECDPNAILRSNTMAYSNNIVVFLSQQQNYANHTDASHKGDAGFSYDGLPISAGDAGTFSHSVENKTNYQLSEKQSTTILQSTLAPESVTAYIACLKEKNADPITILPTPLALTESKFQFRVHWHPDYRAPQKTNLTLHVTNGKIGGRTTVSAPIEQSDVVPFEVTRDNNGTKPLQITATAYGKTSESFEVPALPTFKVKLQPKTSQVIGLCRSGGCGDFGITYGYTIDADQNSVLLPDSLKFLLASISGDQKDIYTCPDSMAKAFPDRCKRFNFGDNDGAHVTGYVSGTTGASEQENKIFGRFYVLEATISPKDAPDVADVVTFAPAMSLSPNPGSLLTVSAQLDKSGKIKLWKEKRVQ